MKRPDESERFPRFYISPFSLEFFEAHLTHVPARRRDSLFHRFKPPGELVARPAERGFRFDAELPGQIGDGEKKVAHFFFGSRWVWGRFGERLTEFCDFLFNLLDRSEEHTSELQSHSD